MKRSNMFNVAWIALGLFSQHVVLDLVNFNYNLFRDPFDVAKFAIEFGSGIGFMLAYRWILGLFWKSGSDN